MSGEELQIILAEHRKWLSGDGGSCADLSGANLTCANLIGADLSGADLSSVFLSRVDLCKATIDGVILTPSDIGGPGWILYALTDDEAETIKNGRNKTP